MSVTPRARHPLTAAPADGAVPLLRRERRDAGCVAHGSRPHVRGKFLYVGEEKLYLRGVTYGTFRPDAAGDEYPPPATAVADLASMAANGINAVRTYTVPPRWLLDAAAANGLFVLPGLGAERLVGHLNDGRRAQARVEAQVVDTVRATLRHPAVLGYCLANEIPAPTVRWLGGDRIEDFLGGMYHRLKELDPDALVTSANYPSTEYLELAFLDAVAFNVFLEDPGRLAAYLARLQNLSGDRPLLVTELGLDSLRNGEDAQAESIGRQVRAAFDAGCAGTFVYAWTDEWHRGGEDVEDWAFGLTGRDRAPKPALAAVRQAYAAVPFPEERTWPRTSVVVCAYNAESTIGECVEAALRLDYPDFEVIVVDDGSTDATGALLGTFPIRVLSTTNRGLSSARNTGAEAATGEIVAYLDSDAYPDPHWLRYLSHTFVTTDAVAVGGPNIPPPGDGPVADCVARSPGGPAHVLLSDTVAEHVPGCNLAVRAAALQEIGGFDPRFRAAGDDVDVCWRLQERGGALAFSPAAVVWHHRRNSVLAYWRQQRGYGRAEALLAHKWPERYNAGGHYRWAGRIYDRGLTRHLFATQRIYSGSWGTAPFQRLYQQGPGTLTSLPLTPEWLLLTAVLAGTALLAIGSAPLHAGLAMLGIALLAVSPVVAQASVSAARAAFPPMPRSRRALIGRRLLTAGLHVLQPLARLGGRLEGGLTLWRGLRVRGARLPVRRSGWTWDERWVAPEDRLRAVEDRLTGAGYGVRRGGDFDRWDLEISNCPLGSARLLLAVEESGGGAQLVRYRCWPLLRRSTIASVAGLGALSAAAALVGATVAAAVLAVLAVLLAGLAVVESGAALGGLLAAAPGRLRETAAAGRPVHDDPTEALP